MDLAHSGDLVQVEENDQDQAPSTRLRAAEPRTDSIPEFVVTSLVFALGITTAIASVVFLPNLNLF